MTSLLDLNSDCSESEDDCDYVPPEGEVSEESGEGDTDSGGEEAGHTKEKSPSKKKRGRKKRPIESSCEECPEKKEEEEEVKLSEEEQKKRVDEIYKSFLEDVHSPRRTEKSASSASDANTAPSEPEKLTVTEEYEFAGETVRVTKEVDKESAVATSVVSADTKQERDDPKKPVPGPLKRPGGGLSSVMGALNKKKQKISTLQKSLIDWNNYKREEGIVEELAQHNRGKGGYLERQAFLQRSDLRQFEIEKSLRLSRRNQS